MKNIFFFLLSFLILIPLAIAEPYKSKEIPPAEILNQELCDNKKIEKIYGTAKIDINTYNVYYHCVGETAMRAVNRATIRKLNTDIWTYEGGRLPRLFQK